MDTNRKQWFDDQQALRRALKKPVQLEEATRLFLKQHAALHALDVGGTDSWSLEEQVWDGLIEAQFRCIPAGQEHSIAWCYWHLARIEDITMNLLVANTDQIYTHDDWKKSLHAPFDDTGNMIAPEDLKTLSEVVDFPELRAYRSTVGKRTREIVGSLSAADMLRKTPPERLQRGLDEGAISPRAPRLLEYWGGLTVAGLLLMPPTRHNFSHINECLALKRKTTRATA